MEGGTGSAAVYASPGITISALTQGTHSITAKTMDSAGNLSAASGALSVTIIAPYTPTVVGTGNQGAGTAFSLVTSETTLSVSNATVGADSAPLNNTIFVTVAMDPTTATVGVADNAGNTYSNDEDVTNGSSTAGVRTLVFSAPVAHALTSGTITVTFTGTIPALKAATFFSFPDLMVPVKDKNHHGTGTTTNTNKVADSGYTTSLAQRNELLIGALGWEDRNITFTPGAGYSALPFSSANTGGNAQDNVTMEPE